MKESLPERRMAQNQVAFRKANERVQKGFDELKAIAEEEGVEPDNFDEQTSLMFICECADENCNKRIKVTLRDYNAIHQSPKCFVVYHNHNVPEIEDIIETTPDYIVLEKHVIPPRDTKGTVSTNVDNRS